MFNQCYEVFILQNIFISFLTLEKTLLHFTSLFFSHNAVLRTRNSQLNATVAEEKKKINHSYNPDKGFFSPMKISLDLRATLIESRANNSISKHRRLPFSLIGQNYQTMRSHILSINEIFPLVRTGRSALFLTTINYTTVEHIARSIFILSSSQTSRKLLSL